MSIKVTLILLLVTLAIVIGIQKYAMEPVQYVMTPNEAVENDIIRTVLSTCHYNGYIKIDKYTFMCVRIGDYDGTNER